MANEIKPSTYVMSDEDATKAVASKPPVVPSTYELPDEESENPSYTAQQPGQHAAPVPTAVRSNPVTRAASIGEEDHGKLRHLAGLQSGNISLVRQAEADPKVNPGLFHQAHIKEAVDTIAEPIHDAWKRYTNSDEYKKASTPQRWRAQRDFITNFHQANPEHSDTAVKAVDEAHAAGDAAKMAHTQEEKRRLENMGAAGPGEMTAKDAAAHFGQKEMGAGEDAMATVRTVGGAGTKFAGQNPEAVKAALANPRFADVPQEDVEVPALKQSKVKLRDHPELKDPSNRALMGAHAGKFAHMFNEDYINKRNKAGGEIDAAKVADAAEHAMWIATHQHNPNVKNKDGESIPMDGFVKQRVNEAIDSAIKAQHTQETSAAGKRAAKDIESTPEKQAQRAVDTKLVTAQTADPEKKAKMFAEAEARAKADEEKKKAARDAFIKHADPKQQERMQHILSVPKKPSGEGEQ
jgi:hypothetical protein